MKLMPQEIEVRYILPSLRKELAIQMNKKGLKQRKIANLLGLTPAAISQYIKEKRGSIKFQDKIQKEIKKATDAAQNAILPMIGCDWIMFGPIELAEYVFPSVAVVDTYILTATAELGTRPLEEGQHPLFKLVG